MTALHSDSAPLALRRPQTADEDMTALVGLGGGVSEVPVAVFLRTSTRDLQDPTLSLPRQLDNCRKVLPPGFVIVAFFYDVESSRKDLDQRGLGNAHEAFNIPIPRDGGLADLLAEAQHPGRRFEAVVVEEIERAPAGRISPPSSNTLWRRSASRCSPPTKARSPSPRSARPRSWSAG
jgi:site-specific DNA recombinase